MRLYTIFRSLVTNSFLRIFLERRLDEERLQIEAKKKEREEQHLFLTAKVCADTSLVTVFYDLLLGYHR